MTSLRTLAAVVLAMFAAVAIAAPTSASESDEPKDVAASYQQQQVDDNDDTRVEVQLVVLAIVIGTVFVFGSLAYFARKRLGLVAPPPDPGVDAHH